MTRPFLNSDQIKKISEDIIMITTEEYNLEETKKILAALDEYVWHDMPSDMHPGVRAKPTQVLTALVFILVEKGLLSSNDIKRLVK